MNWLVAFAEWAHGQLVAMLTQPAGGVGVVEDLGSGYSVEEERMGDVAKLRGLQEEAVYNPEWRAHDITGDGEPETFCNRATHHVAAGMGYAGLRADMYANRMIQTIALDPDWREDSLERAHAHALKGGLALLALEGRVHGHLCSVAAEPMQPSTSWAGPVPIVANVGTASGHGFVKASQAFSKADKPRVRAFLYRETA